MTLEKAIELLTTMKKVCKGLFPPDEQDAVNLGIEALKDKVKARHHGHAYSSRLLPGETEK